MSTKTKTSTRVPFWVTAVFVTMFLHASAQAESEHYKVDSVHSSVIFRVKHMDVSYSYGRFNEPQGTLILDADDPSKSSFKLAVYKDRWALIAEYSKFHSTLSDPLALQVRLAMG